MRRLPLATLATLLLCCGLLQAQVDVGDCDTCYKNFRYDSSLVIGGHMISNPEYASRHYPMTVHQIYGHVMSVLAQQLRNPTPPTLEWIEDPTHPWGGYWRKEGDTSTWGIASYNEVFAEKQRLARLKNIELGMQISLVPARFDQLYKGGSVRENYYVSPPEFTPYLVCEDVLIDTGRGEMNLAVWRRWKYDTLSGEFHWTYLVPAGPDTVKLAGLADWIGQVFAVTNENLVPHLYQEAGLPDRSKWMSVGVALRTDLDSLQGIQIADNAVIAYFDISVRNTQGQDTCTCKFMEPWKRIPITKKWFLERVAAEKKYRAFGDSPDEHFYDIDTVLDFTTSLHGVEVWESVKRHFDDENNPLSKQDTTIDCSSWCADELTRRMTILSPSDPLYLLPGTTDPGYADWGSMNIEVYSTGIVPLSFLRTRVAAPHYTNMREGRYDSLIAVEIDAIYSDTLLDSFIGRIGVGDEARPLTFRSWAMATGLVQRAMEAHPIGAVRPKDLWVNPAIDFDQFRLYGGDFDSTYFRQIHTPVRQAYSINGDDYLPVYYANPDSLGIKALDTVLRLNGRPLIRINTPGEYAAYNHFIQSDVLGIVRNYTQASHKATIPGTVGLVDVMQRKYRERFPNIPSSPVWNVVQTHGFMSHHNTALDSLGFDGFTGSRLPTAEEILVEAWGSMASGATGLIFGDLPLAGISSGVQSIMIGPDSMYQKLEYGMYRSENQSAYPDSDPRWRIDNMWLGLRSRNQAIEEVVTDLFYIDSVLGWKNLAYNLEQMSVHDLNQSFDDIPMVSLLQMERADRYNHDYNDSNWAWTYFTGTDTVDTRDSTYAELTHFRIRNDSNARALLILNRRCWPIDTLKYGARADSIFRTIPGIDTADIALTGFGAIDVRRPRIVIENTTDILRDSAVIERISATSTWRDTVAFGDTVTLEWLLPGRGALYRVEPLPSGISQHSTAYNNAVHSENPSTDTETFDRIIVYERDSTIFLRTVGPDGAWSRELMISDPADTVLAGGKRTASNFFPAVALLRDGSARARVVWERDSLGYRSVVTAFIDGAEGVSRSTIDSTLMGEYTVVRHRASVADSLVGPPVLTPSIVATKASDTTGGFILSWADHVQGINVLALRTAPPNDTLRTADSAGKYQLRYNGSGSPGNVGQYPTLATADIREWMLKAVGSISGAFNFDTSQTYIDSNPPAYPEAAQWVPIPLTHIAWQQGDGVDEHDERIYYCRLGSFFPTDITKRPTLVVDGSVEHVSKNIAACNFQHPSIAVDSVRVGVAFEVWDLSTNRKVVLRFRDTVGVDPATGRPLKEWETYAYAFGETLRFGRVGKAAGSYARPSLTHFPMLDSAALELRPEGGLTWFLQTPLGGRVYRQRLYRYGWFEPRAIDDGAHPSLTLVPLVQDDPFEQTSILQRGPNATRVMGENDEGQDVWYYTGHLLNSPGNPLPTLFNLGPGTGSIIANATITGPSQWHDCGGYPIFDYYFDVTFTHGGVTHPDDDRHGPGDPTTITTEPGLPPTFFSPPGNGATIIDDLGDAVGIVRTGLFRANDQPVTIIRGAAASDSIAEVLDGFPFDFLRNSPADIWSVIELVRASDSVVLWRGDTISARGLDTNAIDTVSHEVEVPVGTYADSGELVFIQVRAFTSPEVIYDVGAEFAFQEDPIDGGVPKAARRGEGETGEALLRLNLVPNPAHDGRTTLHVGTELTGRINVDVWDVSGRKVATLPSIDANRAGTYSVELDLKGMRPGSYLVRAHATESERSATVRLTVVE